MPSQPEEPPRSSVAISSDGSGVSWPMWRAAIWSTEMPAFGFVERGGGTQLNQVPGMIEWTDGLSAGRLPSPLTTVMRSR